MASENPARDNLSIGRNQEMCVHLGIWQKAKMEGKSQFVFLRGNQGLEKNALINFFILKIKFAKDEPVICNVHCSMNICDVVKLSFVKIIFKMFFGQPR